MSGFVQRTKNPAWFCHMKLLVILPRFPYPIEKGDKLRAYHQLRILSRSFDIILVAISHERVPAASIEKIKPFCSKIVIVRPLLTDIFINLIRAFLNKWPLQAGYYYSRKAQRKINRILAEDKPDHIYCQLLRTAAYALDSNLPKTLDYQDVFSKGIERRIPTAGFFMKPVLKFEYKKLLQYEEKLFDLFNNKTIISIPDRNCIPHNGREQIVIVPNGVDQGFFRPGKSKITHDLIFTGNMGYPPNIDCAEYLVKKVLPVIHRTHPHVKLMLAGASPHARVKALASEHVTVTGWVDDIRTCYESARIFLAPMQIGTGLQNKLLEAMSMRLPSITSTLCNLALGAKENSEILIGDTPEAVAKHAVLLLEDTTVRTSLADSGFYFVNRNYSWEGATEKLSALFLNNSKN
ncbi:MAG: glycosyltransferase [Lentimicrobiaceae bacterium]|nr:glycosyltransferase [Lentimicrobiaceae bacterium]MCB9023410.1 glycosyltransferase [Lentimicrobiaceae bacterium]